MAATINSTLYPPQIPTFISAFLKSDASVRIYFTLSSFNTYNDVKHIHVSLVEQKSNSTILKDKYDKNISDFIEDGIYITNFDSSKSEKNSYFIDVPIEGLVKADTFYKVQIRFDNVDGSIEVLPYVGKYENQSHFSEWSTVCFIRAIDKPEFTSYALENTKGYNPGLVTVSGKVSFGQKDVSNSSDQERISSFNVQVLSSNKKDILFDSGAIYTSGNVNPNELNTQLDLDLLTQYDESKFYFRITATTNNGYITEPYDYEFQISTFATIEGFEPKITTDFDNEDGLVNINVTNENGIVGRLHIRRSDDTTNFIDYTDIAVIAFNEEESINIHIIDDTIETLRWYRYACQFEDEGGLFSKTYEQENDIFADYNNIILTRGGQDFVIRYDGTLTSISPKVSRSNTETLGGRYPRFSEDPAINYRTYSIGGYISGEADALQHFLNKEEYFGKRYSSYINYVKDKNNNVQPRVRNDIWSNYELEDIFTSEYLDDGSENPAYKALKHHPFTTQNDKIWERAFREEAIGWLNDGEPKLLRTLNEGNRIVILSDINLTPEVSTGNLLYTFSATATEVAEPTLENIINLGIYEPIDEELKLEKTLDGKTILKKSTFGRIDNLSNGMSLQKAVIKDIEEKNNYNIEIQEQTIVFKNVRVKFLTKPKILSQDGNSYSIGYTLLLNNDISYNVYDDVVQLPDILDITNLQLQQMDEAVIDYEVSYSYFMKAAKANSMIISDVKVGQYSGVFDINSNITDSIMRKYTHNIYQNNVLVQKEYMSSWTGISVVSDPYVVISFNGGEDCLIGSTGVFNLIKGLEINDFVFIGKQMVQRDFSRQRFLREYEFVIDNSSYLTIKDITSPIQNTVYSVNNIYYIYKNGSFYKFTIKDSGIGISSEPIYATVNYIGNIILENVS